MLCALCWTERPLLSGGEPDWALSYFLQLRVAWRVYQPVRFVTAGIRRSLPEWRTRSWVTANGVHDVRRFHLAEVIQLKQACHFWGCVTGSPSHSRVPPSTTGCRLTLKKHLLHQLFRFREESWFFHESISFVTRSLNHFFWRGFYCTVLPHGHAGVIVKQDRGTKLGQSWLLMNEVLRRFEYLPLRFKGAQFWSSASFVSLSRSIHEKLID